MARKSKSCRQRHFAFRGFRPIVMPLEDRQAPGDALISVLMAGITVGDVISKTPEPETSSITITGGELEVPTVDEVESWDGATNLGGLVWDVGVTQILIPPHDTVYDREHEAVPPDILEDPLKAADEFAITKAPARSTRIDQNNSIQNPSEADAVAAAPNQATRVDGVVGTVTGMTALSGVSVDFAGSTNGQGDTGSGTKHAARSVPRIPPDCCPCGGDCRDSLVEGRRELCTDIDAESVDTDIRYWDGTVGFSSTDLDQPTAGFGRMWGHTRGWTNVKDFPVTGWNGNATVILQLPYVVQTTSGSNDELDVITSGTDARHYTKQGSNYIPSFFIKDSLVHDSGNKEFVLGDITGRRLIFNDFNASLNTQQQGRLKKLIDSYGNYADVVYVAAPGVNRAKIEEVKLTTLSGTVIDSYFYSYSSTGRIDNVSLRRPDGGGGWTTIRQVSYVYYASGDSNGTEGDLKSATIKDGNNNVLDTKYYRYYTSSSSIGYPGGLKLAFEPASLARLKAAYADYDTRPDSDIDDYADYAFKYGSQLSNTYAVSEATIQGAGCTSCGGGQGTFTYAYSTSGNSEGYNNWDTKTIENLPDHDPSNPTNPITSQNIVYTNAYGEIMLKVYKRHEPGWSQPKEWITHYHYDGAGRVDKMAHPSTVTGYNESLSGLVDSTHLNSTGLVKVITYNGNGHFQESKLQRGWQGTGPVATLKTVTYTSHQSSASNGSITIYVVATEKVYRDAAATDPLTTSYDYGWHDNGQGTTNRVQRVTITHPPVATGQNGPGTSDVGESYHDTFGRRTWMRNGDGFISYAAYDSVTGSATKSVRDVDTSKTQDFQNLPSGWATPTDGGLHLITQYEVDSLGRTTKRADPSDANTHANVTYMTYNDVAHEVRTYPGWRPSAVPPGPTGPTRVWRNDRGLTPSYVETLTMSATPTLADGRPTGTEAISGIQTLTRTFTNAGGQMSRADTYHNFAGLTYSATTAQMGLETTNYYATLYSYDKRGRRNRVQLPKAGQFDTTTIHFTDYDGLGRPVSKKVGTSDANAVEVRRFIYDSYTGTTGVGDGNLSEEREYPRDGSPERVAQFYYDWRNRQVLSKHGVQTTEAESINRPIIYSELDNLGQEFSTERYDGDTVTPTSTNGVPDRPAASRMRAKSTRSFDNRQREYQSSQFNVNQSTGDPGASLSANTWYDRRGQTIKTAFPGGLVVKTAFDGAGRQTKTYTTDGYADTNHSHAGSVSDDYVMAQGEILYDANDDPLLVTNRARFHDETAQGALGNSTTVPKARLSYVANYYDYAGRLTSTWDIGTNGGSSYSYQHCSYAPCTPVPDPEIRVTTTAYNAAGWTSDVTDARGLLSKTTYDMLGRVKQNIHNYIDGTPSAADDRTTQYVYDGEGHLTLLTVLLPAGEFQKTEYVYGVVDAIINSNSLLAKIKHPDKSTGEPSTQTADQERFGYNALAQSRQVDRNGTLSSYAYDVLGRQVSENIISTGTGVDGAVMRLDTAYDSHGLPYQFTTCSSAVECDLTLGTNVLNQVQRVHNGLGQLITEYQAYAGLVNTGTSPKVQYDYTEMAGGNHSRLEKLIYPNGRVLRYEYNSGSGYADLDDNISRLSFLADESGGGVGTHLEDYSYLGLYEVVKRAHAQPGVDLTYINQPNSISNGGDQYTGLDRFGRIVDQAWRKSDGTYLDRFQYGYDKNDNRMFRDNLVNSDFDELYHANGSTNGYDGLNQLVAFARGPLNAAKDTISSPVCAENWTLDATGNWTQFAGCSTGTQDRTHNKQNQATQVGSSDLSFDNNGNTTTDETGKQFVYDPWNRLVKVKNSGGTLLVTYSYDALGRRIQEAVNGGTTRDLYYSDQWQVIEDKVSSGTGTAQYVWSPVYVDALVLRDRDTNGDTTLDERLYVQQDANWNVTAIVSSAGSVVERYVYDPYGRFTDAQGIDTSTLDASWNERGASLYGWIYLHQGGRYDSTSGLYHFRNRDYSPTLGRWMRLDPVRFQSGDINLYRYASNSAVNFTDPNGLIKITKKRLRTSGNIAALDSEVKNDVPYRELADLAETASDIGWAKYHIDLPKFVQAGHYKEYNTAFDDIQAWTYVGFGALVFFEWDTEYPGQGPWLIHIHEEYERIVDGVVENPPDGDITVNTHNPTFRYVQLKGGTECESKWRLIHVDLPGLVAATEENNGPLEFHVTKFWEVKATITVFDADPPEMANVNMYFSASFVAGWPGWTTRVFVGGG